VDSVNELSMRTNGKIDKEWSPNWEEYRNSLLLMRDGELAVIPTRLREIIRL